MARALAMVSGRVWGGECTRDGRQGSCALMVGKEVVLREHRSRLQRSWSDKIAHCPAFVHITAANSGVRVHLVDLDRVKSARRDHPKREGNEHPDRGGTSDRIVTAEDEINQLTDLGAVVPAFVLLARRRAHLWRANTRVIRPASRHAHPDVRVAPGCFLSLRATARTL